MATKTLSDPDDDSDEKETIVNKETSINRDWWRRFVTDDDLKSIALSPKFEVMFEILEVMQRQKEKCLIFSTSVVCLDIVEHFLRESKSWIVERDYYRLDGATSNCKRAQLIKNFNNPANERVKAFLISTLAGGQGINLTAANRLILLDTSWNPSTDR